MNDVTARLAAYIVSKRIPCALAFRAAEALEMTPHELGDAADRAQLRISCCQLGLFGFEDFGEKRYRGCMAMTPSELREALATRASSDAIACFEAWRIADDLGIPRILAGVTANEMGIRITHCQLGCFD